MERQSVKASSANGSRGSTGPARLTPEAEVRRGKSEFLPSFVALQEAVREACAKQIEWEAKIVGGIYATLEFAAEDADAAGALTINARERATQQIDPEQEVITYFAELLAAVTPTPMLFPICNEESLVESISVVVRAHLQAGTSRKLPEHAPDLAYLTLMPYVGIAGAEGWIEKCVPRSVRGARR
jgi:hypothetical protein